MSSSNVGGRRFFFVCVCVYVCTKVKITPREHIKIVLHYKIKGCIEVFIILEKKWIKSIFSLLLLLPPTFYFAHIEKKSTPCTPDVSLASDEKKIYENHQRSEAVRCVLTLVQWQFFFHGCFIYSHVFYDLSYLHITHHVYTKDENHFILFWFTYYTVSQKFFTRKV